jgi:hypothetical protein
MERFALAFVVTLLSAVAHALAYYMEYQFRFHYRLTPPHIPIFDGYYYLIAWGAFGLGAVGLFLLRRASTIPDYRSGISASLRLSAYFLSLPVFIDIFRIGKFICDVAAH